MNESSCPCGSQQPYHNCCGPYLAGLTNAPTPEALMRSRYTAFCIGDVDYLYKTHHPSKRLADDHSTLAQTVADTHWLGLKVLEAENPSNSTHYRAGQRAHVEFVAFFVPNTIELDQHVLGHSPSAPGNVQQLHEESSFVYEDGRWYYLQGRPLPPIKLGRNEPCFCGSGKRYKRCHGK